jgi:hypothetical protein
VRPSLLAPLAALACAHAPRGATDAREVALRPYAGRLRTLEALVSGVPRPLLLDTGGGITLLTPEAAGAAGCRQRGRHVGLRMSGEKVEFGACGPLELEVAGLRLAPETGARWISSAGAPGPAGARLPSAGAAIAGSARRVGGAGPPGTGRIVAPASAGP